MNKKERKRNDSVIVNVGKTSSGSYIPLNKTHSRKIVWPSHASRINRNWFLRSFHVDVKKDFRFESRITT